MLSDTTLKYQFWHFFLGTFIWFFVFFLFSRNLSTTIFFTLNKFWFFDRKNIYQSFRSHVQRIFQTIINITDDDDDSNRLILPTTSSHLIRQSNQLHSQPLNATNFRLILFKRILSTCIYLTLPFNSYNSYFNHRSSYLFADHFCYAIQLMFNSFNYNFPL